MTDLDESSTPEHIITWANDTEEGDEGRDTRKFGTIKLGNKDYPYLDQTDWIRLYTDSVLQIDFRAIYEISYLHYLPGQDEEDAGNATGAYEIYISKSKDLWGEPVHRAEFNYPESTDSRDYSSLQIVELNPVVSGRYLKIVALSGFPQDMGNQNLCNEDWNFLGRYISRAVNLSDTAKPIISNLPGDIYVGTGSEACFATINWSPPRVRDNYAGATLSGDYEPGESFELGTTKVTYTAMDAAGNASSGSFNIIVTDNGAPFFTSYPENITDTLGANDTLMTVSWAIPGASDLCSEVDLSSSHESGSWFGPGTTEVTYTAEDESGNTRNLSFTVRIERPVPTYDNAMDPGIEVYPVPADHILMISLPWTDGAFIRLYSITGTELKQFSCTSEKKEIDIAGLPAGIYLLHIEFKDRTYLKRAIIQ